MMNTFNRLAPVLLLLLLAGCDASSMRSDSDREAELNREALLEVLADAERDAERIGIPDPKVSLTPPDGWLNSEPRALPLEDHGFTVAYEHESGLGVTLYQFTRGMSSIPHSEVNSIVQKEMDLAKNGIVQAIDLGFWQGAQEMESKTIQIGPSGRRALWTRFELTADGDKLASDIYVWSHSNAIFKIRCTQHSPESESNYTIIAPLLSVLSDPTPQ